MTPQITNQTPLRPTPVTAPSLGQIGIDIETLSVTRTQTRYDQLLAASQVTIKPRRDTAFESRAIGRQIINSRPAVYLTASSNNQPSS